MRESVIYQEIKSEGKLEGKAEGKDEGKDEKAREVAVNLLKVGMMVEQVASVTGLSIEQVQQVQQQQ